MFPGIDLEWGKRLLLIKLDDGDGVKRGCDDE